MASGDLAGAVQSFETARTNGLDTGALHFNLGIAYYRLERLAQARAAFRRATRTPDMAAPAYYNLGRIAREAGRTRAAIAHFERAAAAARSEQIRAAALRARAALAPDGPPPRRARAPSGAIAAGVGHDSNVRLLPEESAAVRGTSDSFGYARFEARWPTGRDGSVFARGYAEYMDDLDDSDLESLDAGYRLRRTQGDWALLGALATELVRFGGETFSYGVRARGVGSRARAGGGWLRIDGSLTMTRGGDGHDYIDGTVLAAGAALGSGTKAGGQWHAGTRLAHEARADLERGDDFYSFSVTELEGNAGYEQELAPGYLGSIDLSLAGRDYRGSERRDGRSRGGREELVFALTGELRIELDPDWDLVTEALVGERNANIDEFDYTRESLQIGVARRF